MTSHENRMGMGFLQVQPTPLDVTATPGRAVLSAIANTPAGPPPPAGVLSAMRASLAAPPVPIPFLNPLEMLRRAARAPVDVAAEGAARASEPAARAATALGKNLQETAETLANRALLGEVLFLGAVLAGLGILVWGVTSISKTSAGSVAGDIGKALALRKMGF